MLYDRADLDLVDDTVLGEEPVEEDATVLEPVEEDATVLEPVEEGTTVLEPVEDGATIFEPVQENDAEPVYVAPDQPITEGKQPN